MQNQDFRASVSSGKKIAEVGAAKVASSFSHLLVSTQKLCRQSLFSQWQTKETEFYGLHSLFEHHYQSLRKAIDAITERLRALGYTPPEQPTWGTRPDDALPPEDMFRSMLKGHQTCAREAKQVITAADAVGDNLSSHLAGQRFAIHDRAARLLLALLAAREPIRSAV